MRTADGAAHQDEPDDLGTDIVAGRRADMARGNVVMTADGATQAGLDRANDDRRFYDCGCLVRVESR
jgi:hypothetical protein